MSVPDTSADEGDSPRRSSRPDRFPGSVFTEPPHTPPFSQCSFYHTMDIPGQGLVTGQWDIRGREKAYLGGVDFNGKRVLELGTADGFLCFHMEGEGAEMITHDLSRDDSWDLVPFSKHHADTPTPDEWKNSIERLNNGYWFAHKAMNSQARACHSSIYDLPAEIGTVDISVLGCILMHVRDPFLALERALSHTEETVVIVGLPWGSGFFPTWLHRVLQATKHVLKRFSHPSMTFLPDHRTATTWNAWWLLPTELVVEFLAVLGFGEYELSFSTQLYEGKKSTVYTIVGHRTTPLVAGRGEQSEAGQEAGRGGD